MPKSYYEDMTSAIAYSIGCSKMVSHLNTSQAQCSILLESGDGIRTGGFSVILCEVFRPTKNPFLPQKSVWLIGQILVICLGQEFFSIHSWVNLQVQTCGYYS